MSARLSEERLAEILGRASAASPGRWESDGAEIYGTLGDVLMIDLWVGETLDIDDQEQSNANAAFIAAARTDVPELVAEVQFLRAQVAGLQQGAARQQARCDYMARAAVQWRKEADGRKAYGLTLKARIAELEAQVRSLAVDAMGALPMPADDPAPEPVEDPHDSPLHHSYALGRDLPEVSS